MSTSDAEEDYRFIGEEEKRFVCEVIDRQQLCYFQYDRNMNFVSEGDCVKRFEDEFSHHLGRKKTLALNSGTSAVEAALAACNIRPGDEVVVTPKSFIASSISVIALNGIPVFADVDPRTGCLTADDIAKKLTEKTKAIMVVHLFGQPAEMDPIMELARKHNLLVIEDCAQAYDAYYKGRKVGTIGDVAAFSTQQSKHITTGEGGLFCTDDDEMYTRAFAYSNCGATRGMNPHEPGRNFFTFGHNHRMGELTAAVGLAQLPKIGEFNERRKRLFRAIEEEIGDTTGIQRPYAYPDTQPNYWLYSLTLDESVGLQALNIIQICKSEEGVDLWYENGFWHCIPNYLEPVFKEMDRTRKTSHGYPLPDYVRYQEGICPKLENFTPRCVVIPLHHGVPIDLVRTQARAIKRMVERRTRRA
jgi:dTDP-4-amino-4,6-dideoxygalactose transaminase